MAGIDDWRASVKKDAALDFCEHCPDHEACNQGMCDINGGPAHPPERCPFGGGIEQGCGICRPHAFNTTLYGGRRRAQT